MSRHPRLAALAAEKFSEGMQPLLTSFVFAGLDSSQVALALAKMLADYVMREHDVREHRIETLDYILTEAKSLVRNEKDRV